MWKERRRGCGDSWWHGRTNGVKNWAAVMIVGVLTIAGAGITAAVVDKQRPADPAAIAEYTPMPAPTEEPRTPVLFMGDSYVAGSGSSGPGKRWTTLVAKEFRWKELNAALGGTGYVASSDEKGCGKSYCEPFPELVPKLSENFHPGIVVVNGGRNDYADLSVFRDSVRNTFDALKSRYPEAILAVTLPLWDDDEVPPFMDEKIEAVREVATDAGVRVLDLGQPLNGNSDLIAPTDGAHPNDAGYRAIADAFIAKWNEAEAAA